MKTYKIIDEFRDNLELGFIFYYESSRNFSIEINPDLSQKEAPVFLESFIKRGQFTIAPEWSEQWVQARIIPSDRQNLGMILRENNMKEYDPCRFLELSEGRCSQDDCAIVHVKPSDHPKWLLDRLDKRIEYVYAIAPKDLILIWRDGQIRRVKIDSTIASEIYPDGDRMYNRLETAAKKPWGKESVHLLSGGTGISWGSGIYITSTVLYGKGKLFPMDKKTLNKMLSHYAMTTSEVCKALDCSRQYVSHLASSHDLPMVKEDGRVRLYARSDVERDR